MVRVAREEWIAGNWDEAIVRYLVELPEGKRAGTGEKLLAAVNHIYPVRSKTLYEAKRLVKQVKRTEYRTTKPPLVWDVALVMMGRWAKRGQRATAVALGIQFHAYLRPGELEGIKVGDIVFPRQGALGIAEEKMWISLGRTKTGRGQAVDITEPLLKELLWELKREEVAKERHIFPSKCAYATRFKSMVRELGMQEVGYTPHSVRHGGATLDYLNGGKDALERVMFRGRWESQAVRTYLQLGVEAALRYDIPRVVREEARRERRGVAERLLRCKWWKEK